MVPRDLLLMGSCDDFGPHAPHDGSDVNSGRCDVFQKSGSERAITSGAVKGHVIWLRGVGDHRADGALNGSQSLSDRGRTRAKRAGQRTGQWVIPTGVKEDKIDPLLRLRLGQHVADVYGIERKIAWAFQPGVDRH